jgi:hypothetical protein
MTIDYHALLALVILALAVSAIAMTMTQGSIFAPFRTWIAAKNRWLGELFACFFCLSHWVAFTAMAIFLPRPLRSQWFVADLVVSTFAMIALATINSGIVFRVFLSAMAVHREREAQHAPTSS